MTGAGLAIKCGSLKKAQAEIQVMTLVSNVPLSPVAVYYSQSIQY